ncbi:DUF6114 domain-containing protein [Actinoplanes utahensis]|uniref:DUF6114 domain-containing protein n=1 Tax=Actinoplanes utahensis TaxID=1869 RepID=UPI0031EF2470
MFFDGVLEEAPEPQPARTAAPPQGHRARRGWREWRRSRPFWAGLFVLLGGAEILLTVWAPLGVVLHVGMQGFIGYLVPVVIIICALLLWFNPAQRLFYSLIVILCALASWLTSNMGGFIIGLLLTLTGGALAFAWTENPDPEPPATGDPATGDPATGDPATGDPAADPPSIAPPSAGFPPVAAPPVGPPTLAPPSD